MKDRLVRARRAIAHELGASCEPAANNRVNVPDLAAAGYGGEAGVAQRLAHHRPTERAQRRDTARVSVLGKANWILDGKGDPFSILALVALRTDAQISGGFAFDQMLCAPIIWHSPGKLIDHDFIPRPATGEDVTVLRPLGKRGRR